MVLPIAVQWVEPQYADPMAGQSREGLLVVWRLADPMVVLPTVAHMEEPPFAGLTVVPIMVVSTVPITVLVPLQPVSPLGRLPVPLRPRVIAITHLIAHRRRTTIRHHGSE